MNVCIVGYGAIGKIHADALAKTSGAVLCGICDIDKRRADSGAAKYGTSAYYDYADVIADKNIDSVHICTPHYLHFEMIKSAADAGKKIVCEKPLVMKECEFDALLFEYANADILPILQNRTNLSIREMKRIIDTDADIGKLIGAKGILTWHRTADYYNSAVWRGTIAYEGGGVLINQAVHLLDLMIYTGGKIKEVSAVSANHSLSGIIETEDTVDARLVFKNGAKGIFYATSAYCEDSPFQMELKFENTVLSYRENSLYRDGKLICSDSSDYIGKKYWGSGHEKVISDYYGGKLKLHPGDIQNTMYTMFAIYKSAANGAAPTNVKSHICTQGEN